MVADAHRVLPDPCPGWCSPLRCTAGARRGAHRGEPRTVLVGRVRVVAYLTLPVGAGEAVIAVATGNGAVSTTVFLPLSSATDLIDKVGDLVLAAGSMLPVAQWEPGS